MEKQDQAILSNVNCSAVQENNENEGCQIVVSVLISLVTSIENKFARKIIPKQEKRKDNPLFSPIVKRKKVATQLPVNKNASTVTVENLEDVLIGLNNFEAQAKVFAVEQLKSMLPADIPAILEGYIEFVAKCGYTYFPWSKVKLLFETKLYNVALELSYTLPMTQSPYGNPNVENFNFDNAKARLFDKMERYEGVPFTIQRIAELLTSHRHYYKTTEKYMTALEKVMLVVSTMEVSPYVEEKKRSLLWTRQIIVPTVAPPSSPNPELAMEKNLPERIEGKSVITSIIMEAVVKPEQTMEENISDDLSGTVKLHSVQIESGDSADGYYGATMEVDPDCSAFVQNS